MVAYAEIWTLKLAGIFPSLKHCPECGELLGRPLHFDAKLVAFVCTSCADRNRELIGNDVIDVIEAVLRMPVAEFASRPIRSEILFEARSLAGTIRRNFLGHELKSFEVLASVL